MPSSNEERKKDRGRDKEKKREDRGVWESEMKGSQRKGEGKKETKASGGLSLALDSSAASFPCQMLVKLWLKFNQFKLFTRTFASLQSN